MRILGIDPGTQFMGLGIIEQSERKLVHVAHELLKPRELQLLPDKLAYIHERVTAAIDTYAPEAVAIENVFHGKNAKSAIVLAHARAVAILAVAQRDLEIFEYAPSQVKRAVGASGAAPKDAVMKLVCALLGLEDIERSDCADALAIAICHLNRVNSLSQTSARLRISKSSTSSSSSKARLCFGEKVASYTIQRHPFSQESLDVRPLEKFHIVRRQTPAPPPKKSPIIRKK